MTAPRNNVIQMWPERENVVPLHRGFVRSDNIRRVVQLPPSVISRHLGDDVEVVNLYQSLEDQARIAEIVAELDAADARLRRMQRAVLWFCYFAAVFAGCLFAFQLGRGAF
jgi:hypothetical protein